MRAALEPLEGNKVKLSVEVDEAEFEKDIDAAFRKISKEVRVPGFRPGKAPRRILEARFGKEAGRAEALRDALPDYYTKALVQQDVDAIAPPEIDITTGQESGPVAFDAVVEVRPQLQLPGYSGLRVVIPSPVVTEEEVAAQIDRLRGNFGELTPVARPARTGDHLTIDLHATRGAEPVPGLTTDDLLYELGSASVLDELDDRLHGSKVGDILAFDAKDPAGDGTLGVKVLVKEVKEKELPELTDEWAGEASEFDTVEELRADISKRMGLIKRVQSSLSLQSATAEALVELVPEDPPATLVDSEAERRIHDLQHRLEHQGAGIEDYLAQTGQSPEQFVAGLKEAAANSVKLDLALRAVAEAEKIEPTDEDLAAEIAGLAASWKVKPAEAVRSLERAGQMPAVRSDWKKSKALEWLIDNVEIVDPDGQPVDRALLRPEESEIPETADATDEQADIQPAENAGVGTET